MRQTLEPLVSPLIGSSESQEGWKLQLLGPNSNLFLALMLHWPARPSLHDFNKVSSLALIQIYTSLRYSSASAQRQISPPHHAQLLILHSTLLVLMNEAENKHFYKTFHIKKKGGQCHSIFLLTDVNVVFKMCAVKLYIKHFVGLKTTTVFLLIL